MGLCGSVGARKRSRVLLLGLDNAGKTTVANFLAGRVDHAATQPTVGHAQATVQIDKRQLLVWDVSGQDKARTFWRHYYHGTTGIVFVVDSNDRQRFQLARKELHAILEEQELDDATIVVLANKGDYPEAASQEEIERELEVSVLTEAGRKVRVFRTVARDGDNVIDAVRWLNENMAVLGAA